MKQDQAFARGINTRLDIDVVSDQDYLNEFEKGYMGFDQTDRYFNGNRMNVDITLLTNENRHGVGILTDAENLCWEQEASAMMLSHNVKVAGLGTKGTLPRALVAIESVGKISGTYRLLLLTAGRYPEFLANMFWR